MAGDVLSVQPSFTARLAAASPVMQAITTVPSVQQAEAALVLAKAQAAKQVANPGACCGEDDLTFLIRSHVRAGAYAEALLSAQDGERPNCFLSLATSTPAVAIASGASTGTISVSIPANTQIVGMLMTQANIADFMCSSLAFNAWEGNKAPGTPANCAMFSEFLERVRSMLPLVGFFWKGTVTASAVFTNVNAASRIFTGLGLQAYNGECVNWGSETVTEQGFTIWGDCFGRAIGHAREMKLLS